MFLYMCMCVVGIQVGVWCFVYILNILYIFIFPFPNLLRMDYLMLPYLLQQYETHSISSAHQYPSALHHCHGDAVDGHVELPEVGDTAHSSLFVLALHREEGAWNLKCQFSAFHILIRIIKDYHIPDLVNI